MSEYSCLSEQIALCNSVEDILRAWIVLYGKLRKENIDIYTKVDLVCLEKKTGEYLGEESSQDDC